MKRCIILVRVSTIFQDFDRQVQELESYAQLHNLEVMKIFSNKISGTKQNIQRKEIMDLIEYVKTEKIDKVLVLEISRLGRNTLEALKVIELLNKEKISLMVKNYHIETLDESGNINPITQFLLTILLEVAEMEGKTIRQRMQSGYENYIRNGGKVGRKTGYCKSNEDIKENYKEEIKLLKKKISLRNITKITGTSINTLRKISKIIN